jgi:hypothetical protein
MLAGGKDNVRLCLPTPRPPGPRIGTVTVGHSYLHNGGQRGDTYTLEITHGTFKIITVHRFSWLEFYVSCKMLKVIQLFGKHCIAIFRVSIFCGLWSSYIGLAVAGGWDEKSWLNTLLSPNKGCKHKSESKLCYDRRSVGQSILVSGSHLGPKTRFLLLSDSCGFVDMGYPLWRKDESVVYNCCCPSPAQSFLGPSPACLRFKTLPTRRTRSPYLYPPGTGWPSYNPLHWVPFSSPSATRRAMVEVSTPPPHGVANTFCNTYDIHSTIRLHGVVLNSLSTWTTLPIFITVWSPKIFQSPQ